jgi:hypothetical protein
MDKSLIRVIDALMWFVIGMTLMARFYCAKYNITSGADYIGWDTALIVIGGVVGMRLVVMLDPSFKADR